MADDDTGARLAELLSPCWRRIAADTDDNPGVASGWWFFLAPPAVMRTALVLAGVQAEDQSRERPAPEWLAAEAERRRGVLAGFAAPYQPSGPRLLVDGIIVAWEHAGDLADEIARRWPAAGGRTALDPALVAGIDLAGAESHRWDASGAKFRQWLAKGAGWLPAPHCLFWWE